MDNEVVFDVRGISGPIGGLVAPRAEVLDLLGLNVIGMPPGRVDIDATAVSTMIDVSPDPIGGTFSRFDICGEHEVSQNVLGGGFGVYAEGADMNVSGVNRAWELLIELQGEAPSGLLAEAADGLALAARPFSTGRDPTVASLADMTIRHLRFGEPDRLYTEGLAIALTARVFALSDERMREVPATGTDRRVDRAIDYVEAHLGESMSVADLASVAAMSPSWFAACFKARTGHPVHAYVLERRLERARTMIAGSTIPLAHVARSCGFADQSHLSRGFKARFGVRPSDGR